MKKANISVSLEKEKIALLDQFAAMGGHDRSYLIEEAIDNYLDMKQWQIEEIKKAIKEADAGDFGTEAQMDALFIKWAQ